LHHVPGRHEVGYPARKRLKRGGHDEEVKKPHKKPPEVKDLPLFKTMGWPPPEKPRPPEAPYVRPEKPVPLIPPPTLMRSDGSAIRKRTAWRKAGKCLMCGGERAVSEELCAQHTVENQQRWKELREYELRMFAEWERKTKSAKAGK
jgi:hypothetical protein